LIDSFPKSATIICGDWKLTGNRITGDPACSSNRRRVDCTLSSATYKLAKEAIGSMSLDGISTTFMGVREPACISDYAETA